MLCIIAGLPLHPFPNHGTGKGERVAECGEIAGRRDRPGNRTPAEQGRTSSRLSNTSPENASGETGPATGEAKPGRTGKTEDAERETEGWGETDPRTTRGPSRWTARDGDRGTPAPDCIRYRDRNGNGIRDPDEPIWYDTDGSGTYTVSADLLLAGTIAEAYHDAP